MGRILLTNHTAVLMEMCFFSKSLNLCKNQLNALLENSKQTYYFKLSSKLVNPATSSKTYWSILKTFLNNKKILFIPSLFHENKFIRDLKEKAELFNTILQTKALYWTATVSSPII